MPSLVPNPEGRSDLLSRLQADQSERWARGERVPLEVYVQRHAELANDSQALLALLHAEVLLRRDEGETPRLDEYLARFPQHADSIRRLWGANDFIVRQQADPGTSGPARLTVPLGSGSPKRPLPTLPGYEILEELGKGGMGVVFKARQVAFDRLVAVKMIRSQVIAGPDELARFRTEALAVGRLDHPHVVRVFAFGEERDCPFFVMEYLSGGSLAHLLREGPLEVRRAAELVRQVARGVQAAHEAGVLHRDLKPGNILLDAEGNARVADFGLAKLLDEDAGQTFSAAMLGTPAYMSPEQAAGRAREVDRAADVWALGVLLYECLTGKVPFRGASREGTLHLIRTAAPTPPRRHRAEVPPGLQAICLKCLEKEPGQRYQAAADLAADLGAWLEGQRPAVSAGQAVLAWLQGHPRTVLLGLALAGALLLELTPQVTAPATGAPRGWSPQVLIGEKGPPSSPRFRLGREKAKLGQSDDGYCRLKTTHGACLDLVPRVPWDRYRIHLQVRHEKSAPLGAVGLYFAASEHPTPAGTVQRCFCLRFNDLIAENEYIHPKRRGKVPLQKGNRLAGGVIHCRDLPGRPQSIAKAPAFFSPEPFTPSGHANKFGEWRTLVVEVAHPEVRVLWGNDTLVRRIDVPRIEQTVCDALIVLKKARPNDPAVQALTPGFDLRGAVGLYLFHGAASFRLARIEPLAKVGTAN